ncbi:MAG: tol-pal system protein YbgF [Cytophagales bacterium]|nr:MAG: tol-pal system protein YbgF [Cytophagales bacterium]TAF61354.1 MAG: tol-pal system protein YbgF [Cytophagales bacterium]
MFLRSLLLSFFLLGLLWPANAQDDLPSLDSVKILLTDPTIQLECTDAINALYNFEFQKADVQFNKLRKAYPKHPLPYFLMALTYWWRIMPGLDSERTKNLTPTERKNEDRFMAYLDSAIKYGEKMADKKNKNIEAYFFLSGAYGFKGRLLGERKNYVKAALSGRNAVKYLEEMEDRGSDFSPEFLFGDGLYNYYAAWIPQEKPSVKPLLWFFKKGDKKLGIEQLETVVSEAFYTKTEGQVFLLDIYNNEKNYAKALEIATYLHTNFPQNPVFMRNYAKCLYMNNRVTEAEPVCRKILENLENKKEGFEETSGRYAAFYLGHFYRYRKADPKAAQVYYKKAIEFATQSENLTAGYSVRAMMEVAEIEELYENKTEAMVYYEKVVDNTEKDNELHKKAKEKIKLLKKK